MASELPKEWWNDTDTLVEKHGWDGISFTEPNPPPSDWKPGEKVLVEAVLGSMMHTMTPDKDRQRKRSETPRGFAQAVFQANHQAMLAMAS